METNKVVNINISTSTILKVFLILLIIFLVYLLNNIIVILFVSLILASLVTPFVEFMQKKRIPRGASLILIYLIFFAILSFIVYSIIPPIINEVNDFIKDSPAYFDKILPNTLNNEEIGAENIFNNIKNGLGIFDSNIKTAAGGVFATVGSLFGGFLSFILILVITFYMVVEDNAMKKVVWSIVPVKHQPYVIQLLSRMQKKVGGWLRGQLILSLIIFIVTYLGLLFLGVKYALVLALIAGLTEFVLYIGPVIAAIPALVIAFFQSPVLALFVLIFYYILNMIETHILVPKIMQKAVGLNPVIVIVVLIVGFKIGGILGGVLAIPIVTAISVFLGDVFERKRLETV